MGRDGTRNGLSTAAFCGAAYSQHRRSRHGAEGGCMQPSDSSKTIIFRANANFFAQKPAAKTEESIFLFVKKRNSLRSER